MTDMSHSQDKRFTGWHALAWFAGFFGLMFAVNAVFLYKAISSFPGEDTPKSYVQGIAYNSVLDQRAEQATTGWTAAFGIADHEAQFVLREPSGKGLSGYDVVATFKHPASVREDVVLALKGAGRGRYAAEADALSPGRWEVDITVHDPSTEIAVFTASKTVFVP
ncbi:MAG: FixH family protein [Pseudomonadota bacterium]